MFPQSCHNIPVCLEQRLNCECIVKQTIVGFFLTKAPKHFPLYLIFPYGLQKFINGISHLIVLAPGHILNAIIAERIEKQINQLIYTHLHDVRFNSTVYSRYSYLIGIIFLQSNWWKLSPNI